MDINAHKERYPRESAEHGPMGLAWSGMGLYLKEAKTPISTIPEDRANQAGRLDSGPDHQGESATMHKSSL